MTGEPATVLDGIARALRLAAAHDNDVEVAPCCVLWPDEAREWEPAIGQLVGSLTLFTLGEFNPAAGSGPAIWVRAQVDRRHEEPPVVYLPGVSRRVLRNPSEMPAELLPLLELQFRGTTFAHRNGRDWTLFAFLSSSDRGGLGIAITDDAGTRKALLAARDRVFVQPIDRLRREAPLKASFFNELLAPDVLADILEWLHDEAAFIASRDDDARRAFAERVSSRFGFDIGQGTVAAAKQLGDGATDPWRRAWNRYEQAPTAYPGIEDRLRAARPKKTSSGLLFDRPGTWPQDNEADELRLRADLIALRDMPAADARARIVSLEAEHGQRRDWVWAKLGRSPLAAALRHLVDLAERTSALPHGSIVEQVDAYVADGWKTDAAVLAALESVTTAADTASVEAAIQALYREWLEASAKRFQEAAKTQYAPGVVLDWPASTSVIFLDGMRYDVGQSLAARLERSAEVEVKPHLAALPTITANSKPAISPGAAGAVASAGLGPSAPGSATELTADGLRKLIANAGWQLLQDETGDATGRAWIEMGDLDELGHKQAPKLAQRIGLEVDRVAERILQLLAAGWKQVAVVTDHGWLYLPGGLPKVQIPVSIAGPNQRKGRCARLKPMANHDGIRMPWFWDSTVEFAMAPGIACFEAGKIYEHGGLSLQECVTPVVIARAAESVRGSTTLALRWRGLWAEVSVSDAPAGARVDVRTKAGDPTTSVLDDPIPITDEGTGRAVADDRYLETAAFAVVLDAAGNIVSQQQTTVGVE